MKPVGDNYFADADAEAGHSRQRYQDALVRCVERHRTLMPVHGLRNPKIGLPNLTWSYCGPYDWVVGFHSGQLWLALQLTGDPVFLNAARARRPVFARILQNRHARDHDLGFQFSLSCVADWLMTGAPDAHALALQAARTLLARYHEEGEYIQAWNPRAAHGAMRPEFAAGRIIADTMQNLALLLWAFRETGETDFRDAARGHAATTAKYLVREDGTSFHTFIFDAASGKPLRGETHQGFADDSCWSRGQAWMIHGFAQCALTTGEALYLDTARKLAAKAEGLMGDDTVPPWDYAVPDRTTAPRDSSAGAIMAAGLFMLAGLTDGDEAVRWRVFGFRLLGGLVDTCDLTGNPAAHGLLAHGAAHVRSGFSDTMLPYGDYFFMEALMRSLGHIEFFW
jgi:unsaturated chondroitin disaccharide hydrolase